MIIYGQSKSGRKHGSNNDMKDTFLCVGCNRDRLMMEKNSKPLVIGSTPFDICTSCMSDIERSRDEAAKKKWSL